jgi:glycosyltransferase involved in cell wall biosynthesis
MADDPRLLFVVTEDWYFASHRLDLARAARDRGFDVALAARISSCREPIEREGIRVFPLRFMRRSSRNPIVELRAISELKEIYRSWRPSIVHHVAAKPVIYGGLASRSAHVPAVVNALAGLGYTFSSPRRRARIMRAAVLAAYRFALRRENSRLIVQNQDDEAVVLANGLADGAAIRRVRGSGVDTAQFTPTEEPPGKTAFVLAGRMLWDKGVGEFVAAARILRDRGVDARFILVGDADTENPAAIPQGQLQRWQTEGTVEWWGHRNDMAEVFRSTHVACLPSYREGLPKVLLEAAACGRALIASDVPGCREIAIHGKSGLLVPPRDPPALAAAMQTLVAEPDLRRRFGMEGCRVVRENFTIGHVSSQTIDIYRELLQR